MLDFKMKWRIVYPDGSVVYYNTYKGITIYTYN